MYFFFTSKVSLLFSHIFEWLMIKKIYFYRCKMFFFLHRKWAEPMIQWFVLWHKSLGRDFDTRSWHGHLGLESSLPTLAYTYTHTHIHTHTHTHTHTPNTYVCTCVCMWVCVCVCMANDGTRRIQCSRRACAYGFSEDYISSLLSYYPGRGALLREPGANAPRLLRDEC